MSKTFQYSNAAPEIRAENAPVLGIGSELVRLTVLPNAPDPASVVVQVAADAAFSQLLASATFGPDETQHLADPAGPLRSREQRFYRARSSSGPADRWGQPVAVEAGLLDADDWSAQPIMRVDDPGGVASVPTPLFRTTFHLDGAVSKARLYATAHGVYDAYVNGQRVSSDLFAPGWTAYPKRLLAQTYDVSDLLRSGENCIAFELADGWYRGRLGWSGDDRKRYGEQLAVLAQLEIGYADGACAIFGTDSTWRTSTAEVRAADFYDGCEIDLRLRQEGWNGPAFDDGRWELVEATTAIDPTVIEPWRTAPVREYERRSVAIAPPTDDERQVHRVDVGQNITGYLEVVVDGKAGDVVEIAHAEVLEADGSLHRAANRTARSIDHFILADDGVTTLTPRFTFHGFRHATVRTSATVISAESVAISSDLPERSTFTCSHDALQQLDSNVRWSLRDNFVSVPTDCPQRDERMGWTGDAQAFAAAANYIVNAQTFWKNWLIDLDLEQGEAGPPSVVPHVAIEGESSHGRAGWADAATIVPWAAYQAFGDPSILEQQYGSMTRWVATQESKLHASGIDAGLLAGEFQFGDWLDPDAPSDQPWLTKTDGDYLANAFAVHSARLTSRTAALLDRPDEAERYAAFADGLAERTWARWGEHASTTQTGCASAIMLGVAPLDDHERLADQLEALILQAEGAVSTGFLGTPLVLPALSKHSRFDAAYTMLLRRRVRSWLYQVDHGATTVWERWDAIKPDGSIHDGRIQSHNDEQDEPDDHHMLSFNHYGYGSVMAWVYANVGGISAIEPGYRHSLFSPRPCRGIDHAGLELDTTHGAVSLNWAVDGAFVADVVVPPGMQATFAPPATERSTVTVDGVTRPSTESFAVEPGHHQIVVTEPLVHQPTIYTAEEQ